MFIRFVLGVLAAAYGCYQLPVWREFPVTFWIILGIFSPWGLIFLLKPFKRLPWQQFCLDFLTGFIIGVQLVFWQSFFYQTIPIERLDKSMIVTGQLKNLVQLEGNLNTPSTDKWRFDLVVSKLQLSDGVFQKFDWPQRPTIRLSWLTQRTQSPIGLHSNQTWQLSVKLKANHGLMNPKTFDYESYLFQNGIRATGYVLQHSAQNLLLQDADRSFRDQLTHYLEHLFESSTFKAVFLALLVGQKNEVEPETWQVLQDTGTIHMMAISGLHMSIVAGMGYLIFGGLWSFAVRFHRRIPFKGLGYQILDTPKPWFGIVGALILTTIYLNLAGFAIPTQRAWLMVVVTLLMLRLSRAFQPFSTLAVVALVIVIWDSKALLSSGFWLSFVAVALIFGALFHPWVRPKPKWQKFWIIQLVLSFGLAPLVAFYYQQFPLMSLFANWLAVPFLTLWGLPVLFLLVLLSFVLPQSWMLWLISWNDFTWQLLWDFLNGLSLSPINQIAMDIHLWQLLSIYGGFYVLIKWQHRIMRFALSSGLLVLLFWLITPKPLTDVQIQILDVGQAQALVLLTPNKTIVLDTGPRWSKTLDGASLAILPTLKIHQRSQIDLLVVSHSDQDHAGGSERLLKQSSVKQAISGQSERLNSQLKVDAFQPCLAGQAWQLDELALEVLAPLPINDAWPSPKSDNDTSCVIKITFPTLEGKKSMLVTGDLSQAYEKRLVKFYDNTAKLQSNILVAGHHGSQTASSENFLKAVAPQVVIFSSGYHNRFGFPNPDVIERVKAQNVNWYNTACSGSLIIRTKSNQSLKIESFRQTQAKWYHHRCLVAEQGRYYQ